MRWPWRLHREWGERAEAARAEAEKSREALARTRAEVVAPREALRTRNHFADLIRASLLEGHGREP